MQCGSEYSTPEVLNDAYELMKKDRDNFADLVKMKKIETGRLTEKTGQPILQWVNA